MKIYNSYGSSLQEFIPIKRGKIGMYVCGPTVYDIPHLGHGRSAVTFDFIRKYFQYRGYKVTFVSNYTDIDDKMIDRAKEEGISVPALANKIIPEYEKTYALLKVDKADFQPKASEHISEIIELISKLKEKGLTYIIEGDGVYFSVRKFEEYGKLSGQNLDHLKVGARILLKEGKKSPYDFVLWKFKKEGEPSWPSPFGEGRPGWHIECSAMANKYLGETFDVHGGGLDLKFPHHECEIAQSESCFGVKSFARYFIHNAFITVDNEKMSKSLHNFRTLSDVLQNYKPGVLRFLYLKTHYRNPIDFTEEILIQAKNGLERIHDFVSRLKQYNEEKKKAAINIELYRNKIIDSLDNDFDSSGAIGHLFDLIHESNKLIAEKILSDKDKESILSFLEEIDKFFGFILPEEISLTEEQKKLIAEREEARNKKDYQKADQIREDLAKQGIFLDDSKGSTILRK